MNSTANIRSYLPVNAVQAPAKRTPDNGSKTPQKDNFQDMLSQANEKKNSSIQEKPSKTEKPGSKTEDTNTRDITQAPSESTGQEALPVITMNVETAVPVIIPEIIRMQPEMLLPDQPQPIDATGIPAEQFAQEHNSTAMEMQNSDKLETAVSALNSRDVEKQAGVLRHDMKSGNSAETVESKVKPAADGNGIGAVKAQDNGETRSQMDFAGNQNAADDIAKTAADSKAANMNQTESVTLNPRDEHLKTEQLQESAGQEALSKALAGETVRIKVAQPHEGVNKGFTEDVAANVQKSISLGNEEVVIQLEPEHLGKIMIKIAFHEDGAKVLMHCSNSKTLGLLAENAKDIGNIVTTNTGNATVVEVKQEETGYWNQQKDSTDEHTNKGGDGQNRNNHGKSKEEAASDFIQQMRLGLFEIPEVTEENLYI